MVVQMVWEFPARWSSGNTSSKQPDWIATGTTDRRQPIADSDDNRFFADSLVEAERAGLSHIAVHQDRALFLLQLQSLQYRFHALQCKRVFLAVW
jgi:3-methyladenine DNA glycosylase Tag